MMLGLYLGMRALEALTREGRAAGPRVAGLAAVGAAAALATLATPYGTDYVVWLFQDLAPPRPEISEWAGLAPACCWRWSGSD